MKAALLMLCVGILSCAAEEGERPEADLTEHERWYSEAATADTSIKYPSMYLRGTFNHWGASAMSAKANGLWSGTATWSTEAGNRFKFDAYGDWRTNFGDDDNDGVADRMGRSISVPARGEYEITYDERSRVYTVTKTEDLPPPTGLRVLEAGSAYLVVIWDDMPDVSGYQREWNGVTDQTLEPFPERYIDKDLEPSTRYTVRVRARYGEVYGRWTEPTVVMTLAPNLSAPSDFEVISEEREVAMRWSASDVYEEGQVFEVLRSERPDGPFTSIKEVPADASSSLYEASDDSGDGCIAHFYKVRMKQLVHAFTVKKGHFSTTIAGRPSNPGFACRFQQVYARGTFNHWGSTPMVLVGDHVWQIRAVFGGSSRDRFKFDVYGDWRRNYGDNDADGHCERNGADIRVKEGPGEYLIEFNDLTTTYSVSR